MRGSIFGLYSEAYNRGLECKRKIALIYSPILLVILVFLNTASSAVVSNTLLVSTSSNRTNPIHLDGASVKGNVYIFIVPSKATMQVAFRLDDTARIKTPYYTDSASPYDFKGGISSAAAAFSTSALADGKHSVTASVGFTDGTWKVVTATFTVNNAVTGGPSVFPLIPSVSKMDFGTQQVGTQSASRKVTLKNATSRWVAISGISVNGNYKKAASDCPATLAAGQSCFVSAVFSPTAVGTRTGEIAVSTSGGTGKIVLIGVGVDKSLASLSWRPGQGTVKGYRIYHGSTGTNATQLLKDLPLSANLFPANAPVYSLAGVNLATGQTMCFRIASYDSYGESFKSVPVCATGP